MQTLFTVFGPKTFFEPIFMLFWFSGFEQTLYILYSSWYISYIYSILYVATIKEIGLKLNIWYEACTFSVKNTDGFQYFLVASCLKS